MSSDKKLIYETVRMLNERREDTNVVAISVAADRLADILHDLKQGLGGVSSSLLNKITTASRALDALVKDPGFKRLDDEV